MPTESQLEDLHNEILKAAAALQWRVDELDGELSQDTKDTLQEHMSKVEHHMLNMTNALDLVIKRIKAEGPFPPL